MDSTEAMLSLTLRQGAVWYMQHSGLSSPEPHFLIVINADPLSTRVLLLSCVTSKIGNTKLLCKHQPETLVEISPDEYGELSVLSAVNGNNVLERSLDEFVGAVKRHEAKPKNDLPSEVMERLKAAVMASRQVSKLHKEMIK